MKATFDKTVSILVKAYLNDTLEHDDCCACAVGNIIKDQIGDFKAHTHFPILDMEGYGWPAVFCTARGRQRVYPENYKDEAKKQIDATGYSWQDLAKIEYAFESSGFGCTKDQKMFNGLMAVIDVLAEIHNIDLTQKETAKALFVK